MNKILSLYGFKKYNYLIFCFLLLLTPTASATNVFNLEGFGPVSRSLAGGGAAHDIGAGGLMYNPATLGLMRQGAEIHLGIDILFPIIELENKQTGESVVSKSTSNNRLPYYGPEIAYAFSTDKMTFAGGVFAQGGSGTEYGNKSFLSRTTTNNTDTDLGVSSRLINLRVPFAAAYKVNDKLILGASVDVIWTSLNIELLFDTTQVNSLIADNRINGSLLSALGGFSDLSGVHLSSVKDEIIGGGADAWGIGGKLGLTYQVFPSTRLGFVYNFETHVDDLTGESRIIAVDNTLGQVVISGNIRIRDFQMPAQFSAGINQVINDQWTLIADYQRVFWKDVMTNVDIGFIDSESGDEVDILLPQNYRDINIYTIGLEYKHNQRWSFRAGFSKADQVLPTNVLTPVLPVNLTTHITAGLSYTLSSNSSIDFAFSHAFENKRSNSSQPNTSVPIESRISLYSGILALVYRF